MVRKDELFTLRAEHNGVLGQDPPRERAIVITPRKLMMHKPGVGLYLDGVRSWPQRTRQCNLACERAAIPQTCLPHLRSVDRDGQDEGFCHEREIHLSSHEQSFNS